MFRWNFIKLKKSMKSIVEQVDAETAVKLLKKDKSGKYDKENVKMYVQLHDILTDLMLSGYKLNEDQLEFVEAANYCGDLLAAIGE